MHRMPDARIRSSFDEDPLAWNSAVDVSLYEIRSRREQWQGNEHKDCSKQLKHLRPGEKPRPSRSVEDYSRVGKSVEGKSERHDGRDAEHDGADDGGDSVSPLLSFPESL